MANHDVIIAGTAATPGSLQVAVGDTVTFHNGNDSGVNVQVEHHSPSLSIAAQSSQTMNITSGHTTDLQYKVSPASLGFQGAMASRIHIGS